VPPVPCDGACTNGVAALTVTPSEAPPGEAVTVTVTLRRPAGVQGVTVPLSAARVLRGGVVEPWPGRWTALPALTVRPGEQLALLSLEAPGEASQLTLSAHLGGTSARATLDVDPRAETRYPKAIVHPATLAGVHYPEAVSVIAASHFDAASNAAFTRVMTYPDAEAALGAHQGGQSLDSREYALASTAWSAYERSAWRHAMTLPMVTDVLLDASDGAPGARYVQATFSAAPQPGPLIGGPEEPCEACFGLVSVNLQGAPTQAPQSQVVLVVWTSTDFGGTYPVGAYTWMAPLSFLPFRELLEEQYTHLLSLPDFAGGRIVRALE
jgi:hypothetical protein